MKKKKRNNKDSFVGRICRGSALWGQILPYI